MKIVSIINYKGGVGKTTLTTNLAAGLARYGYRVLAIDLDPQTNLTFSFVTVEEWEKKYETNKTIKHWFNAIIDNEKNIPSFRDLVIKSQGVDVLSSHLGLIDVDIELAAGLASGTERQRKSNFLKTYSYIRDELVSLGEEYDIALIDCPPNFSVVTRNALIASDYYIVPAKMDYLSTLGINQLRNHVITHVETYNRFIEGTERDKINPEFLGVIANMVSIKNGAPISAQQTWIENLKRNEIAIFNTVIRENNTIYSNSPEFDLPVLQKPTGTTYTIVVTELRGLTKELIEKVRL